MGRQGSVVHPPGASRVTRGEQGTDAMHRSARAPAAGGSLILAARDPGTRLPQGVDERPDQVLVFRHRFYILLSYLSRIDSRFDPAMSGVVMSDHVPDDEVCWCGVPLDCHDDLYVTRSAAGTTSPTRSRRRWSPGAAPGRWV